MTKYEEMPLDTELQHGDRVTFSQPRQGEFLVLFAGVHQDGRMGVILADEFMGIGELLRKGLKVAYVSRPIPEVELPTVPGYYESAEFPVDKNAYAYQLSLGGQWYCGANKVTVELMREVMPLARLVPETTPANLVDRLDVEKMIELLKYLEAGMGTWRDNAADIIAAIDNGELDK